jgi:hypothetical protein
LATVPYTCCSINTEVVVLVFKIRTEEGAAVAAMAKTSVSAGPLMRMLLVVLCAAAFLGAVNAADPDPLQDFCVADLSANAPLVNGFPCKPRSTVTAEDFVFKGLRKPGE